MLDRCSLCGCLQCRSIYSVEGLPVFQNVVFDTRDNAINTRKANVDLVQCTDCGFVFNRLFNSDELVYSDQYQNEQGYSFAFRDHLNKMVRFVGEKLSFDARIVEIGCGKGLFLELLKDSGFEGALGYDPAYEGSNDAITKGYFSEECSNIGADLIVLRHVLEHMEDPLGFLNTIARTNQFKGNILIEVPDLEWIMNKKAFWDVYYEHCNYFTTETLGALFRTSEIQKVFNDQYLCLTAKLSDLRKIVLSGYRGDCPSIPFKTRIDELNTTLSAKETNIVWGGSSKGVTLLNIIDKDRKKVEFLIDINPKKQGKFIGGTGHQILPPDFLKKLAGEDVCIIITNENYCDEIVREISRFALNPNFVML